MIRHLLLGLAALTLVGCTTLPNDAPVEAGPNDIEGLSLAGELIQRTDPGPPSTVPGECWAHEILPAVIETVTEHAEVSPARAASDGEPAAPAVYRSVTRQKIVRDRRDVWFRTPCADNMTPGFIASLQRALKARGLYLAAPTGEMDPPTRLALRRYQAPLGIDSETLSMGAARQLGLVAYDLYRLKHGLD